MLEPILNHFENVYVSPPAADIDGPILLGWQIKSQEDRLVQVYVDGQLYDVASHPQQRLMWLHLDRSCPHQVELLAVATEQAWMNCAGCLQSVLSSVTERVGLVLLRDEALPIDSRVIVEVDGEEFVDERLWSAGDHRSGFGGLFGVGQFGYDDATSLGFGLGDYGESMFGDDGQVWRWHGSCLKAGDHAVDVRIESGGVIVKQLEELVDVHVEPWDSIAKNLRIENGFSLKWNV